ncbi:MAG: sporulation initiation factor Spo0A C-terminal domain-containing protein [Firmicutes bacterium]|nr:sporulation initiation factor Spo0A C-terminal domain-containing protein [Bacillota bacterium]
MDKRVVSKQLYNRATMYLYRIGMPINYLGFSFFREAVMLCVENRELLKRSLCDKVYAEIAKRKGTKWENVERNIRNLIEQLDEYNYTRINELLNVEYCVARRKPTNRWMISLIVDKIKLDMLMADELDMVVERVGRLIGE